MSDDKRGWVYLLASGQMPWYKIGRSKDPDRRVKQLNAEHPEFDWRIACRMFSYDCPQLERLFHNLFGGERITAGKEWFKLSEEGVAMFHLLASDQGALVEEVKPRSVIERIQDEWCDLIRGLKERRQALTAILFEEARVEHFDGSTLWICFPEEQGFYAEKAREEKHVEELGKVLEGWLGFWPRLEFGIQKEAA